MWRVFQCSRCFTDEAHAHETVILLALELRLSDVQSNPLFSSMLRRTNDSAAEDQSMSRGNF
jgi:hypothetical protein